MQAKACLFKLFHICRVFFLDPSHNSAIVKIPGFIQYNQLVRCPYSTLQVVVLYTPFVDRLWQYDSRPDILDGKTWWLLAILHLLSWPPSCRI